MWEEVKGWETQEAGAAVTLTHPTEKSIQMDDLVEPRLYFSNKQLYHKLHEGRSHRCVF